MAPFLAFSAPRAPPCAPCCHVGVTLVMVSHPRKGAEQDGHVSVESLGWSGDGREKTPSGAGSVTFSRHPLGWSAAA